MRHITLDYVKNLLDKPLEIKDTVRRPRPMPGKAWPTRVAWHIQVAQTTTQPNGVLHFHNHRSLNYIGRPNRYRALQAHKFLTHLPQGFHVLQAWQAEFDAAGLVAFRRLRIGQNEQSRALDAFYAYHPHSPHAEIIQAFLKPLYLKYIGGMRLYSQKRKLAGDAVDAYYAWYKEHFKKGLRRPKSVPSAVIAGEPMEPAQEQI